MICKCAAQAMQSKERGATRKWQMPKWQWNHSVWASDNLAVVDTECEICKRKSLWKSKQWNTFLPYNTEFCLAVASKTNKKQLIGLTSNNLMPGYMSMALHLLDCMSCPFCFQKTLVTISPVAWKIVATLQVFPDPLSHLIIHLREPLSCLVWAASPAVQIGKFSLVRSILNIPGMPHHCPAQRLPIIFCSLLYLLW